MRRFRNIIIENVEYKWLFRYEDYDDTKFPYLLIVKKCIPEETLRIKFWITEHFLLNSGLPAIFQGKMVAINLNQPFYISQIIQYYRHHEAEILQAESSEAGNRCSYRELDGVKILQRLGYHILSLSLAGMKDKCYD